MQPDEDVKLEEILGDPGKSIVFLRFCETVHCEENALFYLAVERMRKLNDRSAEQLQACTDIYEKYVATGASFCIQTPSHVKEDCKNSLTPASVNRNIFDHAQRLVLSLLASEYLAGFIASQSYLNLELEGILLHPERGEGFMRFLRGRYSEENMLFYNDVTRWQRRLRLIAEEAQEKKVPINQIRQEVLIDARSIFNQYLKHHAEFKIDVSDEARTRVVHEINAATRGARINPTVFQECLERVMRIMRVELLPDFLANEREELEKEKQLDHERQTAQQARLLAEQQAAMRRPVSAFSNKPVIIGGKGDADDEDLEPIPIPTPASKLPKFLLSAAQNDFIDMSVVKLFNKIVVKQEVQLQKKKKVHKPMVSATPTKPTHASSNSMSAPVPMDGKEPHSPLPPILIKKGYVIKRRHSVDAADLRVMADVQQIYRVRTEKKQRKQKSKEKLTKRLAKSGIDLAASQQSSRNRAISESLAAQARAANNLTLSSVTENHGETDAPPSPNANTLARPAATVTITAPSPHAPAQQASLNDLFSPLNIGPPAHAGSSSSSNSTTSHASSTSSVLSPPSSQLGPPIARTPSPSGSGTSHNPSSSTDMGNTKLSTPGDKKKGKKPHHRPGRNGASHSEDWNNTESQDSSSSDEGEGEHAPKHTPPESKILGELNIDDDSPHLNRNFSIDAYARPGRAFGPNPLGHGSVDFSGSYAQSFLQKKKHISNMETDPVTGRRNAEREAILAAEEDKERKALEPQRAEAISLKVAGRLRKNARNFQLHSRAAALKAADPQFALLCNARSDPVFYGAGLRPAYGHGRGSQTADDNVLTLYKRRLRKLVRSKLHVLAGPKIAVLAGLKRRSVLAEDTEPKDNLPIKATPALRGKDGKPIIDKKGSTMTKGRPATPSTTKNNVRFLLARVVIPETIEARNTLVAPPAATPNTPAANGSQSPTHTHGHTTSGFNFPPSGSRDSASNPGHPREPRPILKFRREGTFDEFQAKFLKEQEKEQAKLFEKMIEGSPLTKYNAMGKGAKRFFFVSDDGTELCWTANARRNARTGIFSRVKRKTLADVTRMRYGSRFSRRFYQYNNLNRPPWLSFTVCFPDRTVDIVCKDEDEVSTWYLGLQSLAPLSPGFCSRGGLLWRRARLKIKYNAKKQMMNERQFLNRLIDEAKDAVRQMRIADARSPPRLQIPGAGSGL